MRRGAKVFGIGLSKTGTTSLDRALEILGFQSVHYPDASAMLAGRFGVLDACEAACDISVSAFFAELDRAFPGSLFVLTTRDMDAWLGSMRRHYSRRRPEHAGKPEQQIFELVYGAELFDEALFRGAHERHSRAVREHFAGRPGSLLECDICAGEQWGPLCEFLGLPEPDAPFPHLNQSASAGASAPGTEPTRTTRPIQRSPRMKPGASRVTLGAIQIPAGHGYRLLDEQRRLQWLENYAEKAASRGCDILLAPRFALHAPESTDQHESIDGPIVDRFRRIARSHRIIFCPHIIERAQDGLFDTTIIIDASGEIAGAHRSTIPEFDAPGASEMAAGSECEVIETEAGRLGVLSGLELWLPENAQALSSRGCDIILHPHLNDPRGESAWRTLVRARAIDTGCAIVAALGASSWLHGTSMIVDRFGAVNAQATDLDQLILAEVDLGRTPRNTQPTGALCTTRADANEPLHPILERFRSNRPGAELAPSVTLESKPQPAPAGVPA